MRTLLVALLVIVCLAVIALPAFIVAPNQPSVSPRPDRDSLRASSRRDVLPVWTRLSPFGAHTDGWRGILSAVASWVYLYLTSVLMLGLVPHRVRLITQAVQSDGWRERGRLFLIGLLAALVSALLVVLARFAFVWVVLVIVLTGAVFVLSFVGLIGISLMVGGAVRRWARFSPMLWGELAIGSLILFALGHIPVAGWILIAIVMMWGLGAVLATHMGSGEAWSLRDWQTTN